MNNLSAYTENTMKKIEISVIVPMYDEMNNVDRFFENILNTLRKSGCYFEIICINDGSRDDTLSHLIRWEEKNPEIKIINLSRNFGKEMALCAGLDYSSGDAIILIDADLQHPPDLIFEFIKLWRNGYDIVYATRKKKKDKSFFRYILSYFFYLIFNILGEVQIPEQTGEFRLLDRRVAEIIKSLPERNRFMKGIFAWVGFRQKQIYYDEFERIAGTSTWSLWKLWNFALDGIFSFSTLPLRIWTYFGLFVSISALLYACYTIFQTIIFGIKVPGYASLLVVGLFLGGVQLIGLGILGEYLGRVYQEVKNRPLYIVQNTYGFENNNRNVNKLNIKSVN